MHLGLLRVIHRRQRLKRLCEIHEGMEGVKMSGGITTCRELINTCSFETY
jgi:hypothetical protein